MWGGATKSMRVLAACQAGNLDELQSLTDADTFALIDSDPDGRTPMHAAAAAGRLHIVDYLLQKRVDLDSRNVDGATALCEAAAMGHDAVVARLLAAGASANLPCQTCTALHEAAAASCGSVCRRLIAAGGRLDASDCWHGTPLHTAAAHGSYAAAIVLLQAGSNVNGRILHRTPLHLVIEMQPGLPHFATAMLAYGADACSRDATGRTPADLLCAHLSYSSTMGDKAPVHEQQVRLYGALRQLESQPRTLRSLCSVAVRRALTLAVDDGGDKENYIHAACNTWLDGLPAKIKDDLLHMAHVL